MKIARDDSAPLKPRCSDSCGLPLNASEQGYQSKLLFFHSKAVDVVPEAYFIAMTEDRHNEVAAMDLSMIAVALTPSWLVWILTAMPVWLYFS